MRVSKSSADLRRSERAGGGSSLALAGVILLLAATGIAAAAWCLSRGYTLYDGDAEAHLNIARRVLDSRTPGLEQLGTVWLPLPHILMIPFAMHDAWWRSGAAGAIPSCACFILAGAFLFASARRMYGSEAAGLAVALLFALNPNMLYLQSTAMTEPVEMAAVMALLWSTLWFRDTQSMWAVFAAAIASNIGSMTRYESWFLIPFVSLYLLLVAEKKSHAVLFMALAGLGPVTWLAGNRYFNGNALEFYNGPYSAAALLKRQAAEALHYPTDHNWREAILHYRTAARLVVGGLLLTAGVLGAVVAVLRKVWWPLALLGLVPVFYVWSLHSGGVVLTLPQFGWSLYNTRYAIAALPLAALAAGALTTLLPSRWQGAGAVTLAVLVSLPMWFWPPTGLREAICWREAAENSETRRMWTGPAGQYLAENYRPGAGILFTFGSGLAEVLRRADIPLQQGLHEGNGPAWEAAITQPETFVHEEWALAIPGDTVSMVLMRAEAKGLHYELRRQILVKGKPMVEFYHRQSIASPNPVR
jgi:hypothetical protein